MVQRDDDVLKSWSGAAPFWEKYRETIQQMFAPVTTALVADAEINVGDRVLDVATGPGEPALSIAPLLEPGGKVVGIDPIPEMVAAAERAAEQLAVRNAEFEVGFGDQLPFPAGHFDAVVSRFGIMFCPSALDAAREMLRVLKPGRKLALAVWHSVETNPYFYTLQRVIEKYVDPPPPAPDALDAFRFASPGKLQEVLSEAGFLDASERLLQFTIRAPVSVEEFWTLRYEMSEKLREKVAMLSSDQLTDVKREVFEALSKYSTGGVMSLPAEVLLVSGTKRRSG